MWMELLCYQPRKKCMWWNRRHCKAKHCKSKPSKTNKKISVNDIFTFCTKDLVNTRPGHDSTRSSLFTYVRLNPRLNQAWRLLLLLSTSTATFNQDSWCCCCCCSRRFYRQADSTRPQKYLIKDSILLWYAADSVFK